MEITKINYEDQDSLIAAFRGQDALIITLNVTVFEQHKGLLEAAAAAGVPWVLPNEYGFETDEMTGALRQKNRDHIESLGKNSWIGIACGFWYEYSLSAGEPATGFDPNNRAVTLFVDLTDVGED